MNEKDLIAKLVDFKLRAGEPPRRMCRRCGNSEYFTATVASYEPALIWHQGTEEHLVERYEAKLIVAGCQTINSSAHLDKKVLKRFLDETANDELTNEPDLIGVGCLRCGATSEDIIDRDELEELVKHRKEGAK